MKILFIAHRIPYPPNKGDKIRSYHIIKYLARYHEVSLACLIDDPKDAKYINDINPLVKNIFYDMIKPLSKKVTSTFAIFQNRPITTSYFYSNKVQKDIDSFLDNSMVDTVFCFSSPTAEYLFRSRHYNGKLRKIRWIMDLIDMDSDKWRLYANKSKGLMRYIYSRESTCLLSYEDKLSKEFDYLILVSEAERTLFLSKVNQNNVIAMANGVDLRYFSQNYNTKLMTNNPALVFTGAMDYWPNVEGVVWFCHKIYPKIRKRYPELVFYIVGSNPTSEVRGLAQIDGIYVTGFVDDVRDYIAIADVCIVPLRTAMGIQNKVLEAMAMGKPVVTTPQGLEGINAVPDDELLSAQDVELFSKSVIRLLADPELCQKIGRNARKCVENNYSWHKNLSIIDQLIS